LPVRNPGYDDGRLVNAKMTDNLEALPERVDRIEQKLDNFVASVDKRFDEVDRPYFDMASPLPQLGAFSAA
jgi:hypothetical protein